MITVSGPWCPVCDSRNIRFTNVQEPVAWSERGPITGTVQRGVCLDCKAASDERFEKAMQRAVGGLRC